MILINKVYGLAVGATAICGSGAVMSYLSKEEETVKEIIEEQLPEPEKKVNTIEQGREYVKEKYKQNNTVKTNWTRYKDLDFGVDIR